MTLKSIRITHVQYESTDLFAKILAYSSLIPIFLIQSLATLAIFQRDHNQIRALLLLGGQFANELINLILKKLLKHPRPEGIHQDGGYGMPSSHTQFMWFFVISTMLLLKTQRLKNYLLILCAVVVSYSRIYLGYHSTLQVLVGAIIGFLNAIAFFTALIKMRKIIILVLQNTIGILFGLNDINY